MFPHLKYSEADVDGYISGATPEMVAASLGKAQATELFVKSVLAAQICFWMQSGIAHGDVMFRVGDVQIPPGGVWTPSSPMGAVFAGAACRQGHLSAQRTQPPPLALGVKPLNSQFAIP